MNNSNAIQAQPQKLPQKPKFSVAITTKGYQKLINNTLGDPARASRFVASITSAVAATPALQDCDAGTILAGALLGESLGLSPSPQLGQFYLVPFECKLKGPDGKNIYLFDDQGNHLLDKRGRWLAATEKKAAFVLGYKGYIQLALRSNAYADLDVMEIKEGEYLGRNPNNGKPKFSFIEDDEEREEKPVIGYMAYLEYLSGFRKVLYWPKAKMLRHADEYSQAFSAKAYQQIQDGEIPDSEMWKYSSHWYTNFDEMAKKTMIRQLISRWGLMTTTMQQAIANDTEFTDTEYATAVDELPGASAPELPGSSGVAIDGPIQPEADEVVEAIDLASL